MRYTKGLFMAHPISMTPCCMKQECLETRTQGVSVVPMALLGGGLTLALGFLGLITLMLASSAIGVGLSLLIGGMIGFVVFSSIAIAIFRTNINDPIDSARIMHVVEDTASFSDSIEEVVLEELTYADRFMLLYKMVTHKNWRSVGQILVDFVNSYPFCEEIRSSAEQLQQSIFSNQYFPIYIENVRTLLKNEGSIMQPLSGEASYLELSNDEKYTLLHKELTFSNYREIGQELSNLVIHNFFTEEIYYAAALVEKNVSGNQYFPKDVEALRELINHEELISLRLDEVVKKSLKKCIFDFS